MKLTKMGTTGGVTLTAFLLLNVACVLGLHYCESSSSYASGKYCDDDEYCCGDFIPQCCESSIKDLGQMDWQDSSYTRGQREYTTTTSTSSSVNGFGAFMGFIILVAIVFCPIYLCYRCCCAGQRGHVYTQTATSPQPVASPPPAPYPSMVQHQLPYPSVVQPQAPYPSMVPYPQQTPYPPQPSTNPYIGMPSPPPYGVVAQDSLQQASAPTLN